MNGKKSDKFDIVLPAQLIADATSLENIGHNTYAWRWRDALTVINILIGKKIFVLGGDVYLRLNDKFEAIGDNWYVNKKNYIATELDLSTSHKVSIEYIEAYVKRNGENYYFSIVADFNQVSND